MHSYPNSHYHNIKNLIFEIVRLHYGSICYTVFMMVLIVLLYYYSLIYLLLFYYGNENEILACYGNVNSFLHYGTENLEKICLIVMKIYQNANSNKKY